MFFGATYDGFAPATNSRVSYGLLDGRVTEGDRRTTALGSLAAGQRGERYAVHALLGSVGWSLLALARSLLEPSRV